jgi:hypothetical protein
VATFLPPTQITFPNGTTWEPDTTGVAFPAGLTWVTLTIDTAAMPAANTMTVTYEAQFSPDPAWYTLSAITFTGGTYLRHGVATSSRFVSMSLDPTRYPTQVRVRVDNSPGNSQVTLSATAT